MGEDIDGAGNATDTAHHRTFNVLAAFEAVSQALRHQFDAARAGLSAVQVQIQTLYDLTGSLLDHTAHLAVQIGLEEEALTGLARISLGSISQLVADLQYHDIISQQLEHVGQTNAQTLVFLTAPNGPGSGVTTPEKAGLLAWIARLQIAQLNQTETTYRHVARRLQVCLTNFKENCRIAGDTNQNLMVWLPEDDVENARQSIDSITFIVGELNCQISTLEMELSQASSLLAGATQHAVSQLQQFAGYSTAHKQWLSSHPHFFADIEAHYTMQREREIFRQCLQPEIRPTVATKAEGEVELF